jgi:two-component system NtrC family response regulator
MVTTILMAEDDFVLREQLGFNFRGSFRILEADNRDQALGILRSNLVDIALVDLHLPPQLDGPEEGLALISRIAMDCPYTFIIAMSGYASEWLAIESLDQGAHYFLPKPIDLQRLKTLIRFFTGHERVK